MGDKFKLPDSSGYVAEDFMEKICAFKKDGQWEPVGVITAVDLTDRKRFEFGVTPFDKIPHSLDDAIEDDATFALEKNAAPLEEQEN